MQGLLHIHVVIFFHAVIVSDVRLCLSTFEKILAYSINSIQIDIISESIQFDKIQFNQFGPKNKSIQSKESIHSTNSALRID